MDLRQVRCFVALYEEGSITKAAKRLHIVQPAVSMQIRKLETYNGIVLFDRTANGAKPNAAAHRLYPLCIAALEKFGYSLLAARYLAAREEAKHP